LKTRACRPVSKMLVEVSACGTTLAVSCAWDSKSTRKLLGDALIGENRSVTLIASGRPQESVLSISTLGRGHDSRAGGSTV